MGAMGPPIFTPTSLSPAHIGLLLGRAGGETEARRQTGREVGRGDFFTAAETDGPSWHGGVRGFLGLGVLDHGVDSTGN